MLKKEGLLKVDLAGKNIIVVGGGLSGQAVCRYLVGQESKVTLFDDRSAEKFGAAAAELAALGVEMCLDGQIPAGAFDLCLKSPGIPPTHPLLVQLADAKTPIIGEIELAYLTADAAPRFIGITGTNGKTTTTTLLELMLRQAGRATLLGGNIGAPLVGRMGGFGGSVVAELSSFQLEDSRELHINTALFLNLTPDHLDRHGDIEGYFAAKAKIFAHQTAADTVVLNADDEWCIRAAALTPARKLWFSLAPLAADQDGLELCDGDIRIKRGAEYTHLIRAAEIYIKGRHNWQNAMAAAAAVNIKTGKLYMPGWVRRIAQILSGALIGTTVTRDSLVELRAVLIPAAILCCGFVCINIVLGLLLHKLCRLDMATAFLSSAVGGATEAALAAPDLDADPSVVSVLQISRMVCTTSFYPLLVQALYQFL